MPTLDAPPEAPTVTPPPEAEDDAHAFSAKLHEAITKAGLPLAQVSALLDQPVETIRRWLVGGKKVGHTPPVLTQEGALARLVSLVPVPKAAPITPQGPSVPVGPIPPQPLGPTQKIRQTMSMGFIHDSLARHNRQKPSAIPEPIVHRHAAVGQEIGAAAGQPRT